MKITFPTTTIAHLESDDILNNAQEAAELLMNCHYQGADSIYHSRREPSSRFLEALEK